MNKQELNGSRYLVARSNDDYQKQQDLVYQALEPVFLGRKQAASQKELDELFAREYGIDVKDDFVEGDDHFEEYMEASQAIAEGMSIYGGNIGFEENTLANLAEQIWEELEQKYQDHFRRINTMLEE